MKGSTHIFLGTLAGIGTQLTMDLEMDSFSSYPEFYGGIILGSLLPDIDHPQSYLGRRIRFISIPIFNSFGHRGITHSTIFITSLGLYLRQLGIIPSLFSGGIILGYIIHLLADFFTPSGIPLFYPYKKRQSWEKMNKSK